MKFIAAAALISTLFLGAGAQPVELEERATTMCGQWDSTPAGPTTLYNNLWGKGSATSGSECTTLNTVNGNSIAWSTSWSWAGGQGSVKAYPNARISVGKSISSIKSIPSTWNWTYTGSNIVADVSYDIFTGNSTSSTASYEIMIWLAALGGAGPISSGQPLATVTIDNVQWKLHKGPNGSTTVFSFVATSQQPNFSGDLLPFFNYLRQYQGLSSSQVIQGIGAGTEPFTGSNAVFTTSQYNISVN